MILLLHPVTAVLFNKKNICASMLDIYLEEILFVKLMIYFCGKS